MARNRRQQHQSARKSEQIDVTGLGPPAGRVKEESMGSGTLAKLQKSTDMIACPCEGLNLIFGYLPQRRRRRVAAARPDMTSNAEPGAGIIVS